MNSTEDRPEATSLMGEALYAPSIEISRLQQLEADLERARMAYRTDPGDPENAIWLGRRTAYLGRYREAISIYSQALEEHPDNPKLLRHRGHRYISVREFEHAIADLEKASRLIEGTQDEIEPDGVPNSRNQPTSSLFSNIWYHLGLAYYLQGDFENALRCYRQCFEVSGSDDMKVATAHWLYMTLRRLGRSSEAAEVLALITEDLDVFENLAYLRLLQMYRGEKSTEEVYDPRGEDLDSVTLAYGVGNWFLYNEDPGGAREVFERILENREEWPAFAYLAAEAEMARWESRDSAR